MSREREREREKKERKRERERERERKKKKEEERTASHSLSKALGSETFPEEKELRLVLPPRSVLDVCKLLGPGARDTPPPMTFGGQLDVLSD